MGPRLQIRRHKNGRGPPAYGCRPGRRGSRPPRAHRASRRSHHLCEFPGLSQGRHRREDRKSTRLNSSHGYISYAVFCLKKKKNANRSCPMPPLRCSCRPTSRTPLLLESSEEPRGLSPSPKTPSFVELVAQFDSPVYAHL